MCVDLAEYIGVCVCVVREGEGQRKGEKEICSKQREIINLDSNVKI